jgi:hypothetical protein
MALTVVTSPSSSTISSNITKSTNFECLSLISSNDSMIQCGTVLDKPKSMSFPPPEIVSPNVSNVNAELVRRAYISKYLAEVSSIDSCVSGHEVLDDGPDSAVFSVNLEQLVVHIIFLKIDSLLSKKLHIPLL